MKSLELTKKINCQNKECNLFLLKKKKNGKLNTLFIDEKP